MSEEPHICQSFVLRNKVSPIPGHTKDQELMQYILGVLTSTASKGANVKIWYDFNPGNS